MINKKNIIFLCQNGSEIDCLNADQSFENRLKFKNLHKIRNTRKNKSYFEALQFHKGFLQEDD